MTHNTTYKWILLALGLAWSGTDVWAQDDTRCGATVIALDGSCITSQTNIGSTADTYVGCCTQGNSTVWYKFTPSGSNNQIVVTFTVPGTLGGAPLGGGGPGTIECFVGEKNNCTGNMSVETQCGTPSAGTLTLTFGSTGRPLWPGFEYYFMIGTSGANEGNFDICVTEQVAPTGNQTGPEQDCSGAFPVCNDPEGIVGSYIGNLTSEVATGCLLGGENNSVWYSWTVQTGGTFGFTLTTSKDYDWALYNITSIGCGGIPGATPVRCNWSGTLGNTGMTAPGSTEAPSLAEGGMGSPTMNGISDMTVGDTYALIVDNWTGDNNGFSLSWAGTAVIVDATAPTLSSAVASCTANTFTVTMSENIVCNSVNQSDFKLSLTPPGTDVSTKISAVAGVNCSGNGAMTDQILFTHDGTLATGSYTLEINTSPGLQDACGNLIVAAGSVTFDYLADNITLSASTNTICNAGDPVTLDADGIDGAPAIATYTFNPGTTTNTTDGSEVFNPTASTTYAVEVTFGGCTRTSTGQTISLQDNVVVSISPVDPQICSGTETLTASTTINGGACPTCTYVWSTAATTSSITEGAGTYTVEATTPAGCSSLTPDPSSTISLASGAVSTCNIYYVDNGATVRDGLTKTTPTTLADAITKAACTNSILKLSGGVYSLSDRLLVTSYLTIEGGYYNTYANKSSDLAGGANNTVIRRDNTADSDDAAGCTAFKLGNSATGFEFRNLRIEMPGSPSVAGHTLGAGITNYGIRMGTTCTGYNIIRCYINTGAGSD